MRNSKVIQSVFTSEEQQFTLLNSSIEDIKKQLDIDTATWGLVVYEKELKIPTNLNKPLNDRRSVIKSKLRANGKVDSIQIKLVADAYTNGDVLVSFNGHIVVKFNSVYGIPPNLEDLKFAIEDVKPAHLAVDYEFNYLLIKEIHNLMTLAEMEQIPLNKFAGGV